MLKILMLLVLAQSRSFYDVPIPENGQGQRGQQDVQIEPIPEPGQLPTPLKPDPEPAPEPEPEPLLSFDYDAVDRAVSELPQSTSLLPIMWATYNCKVCGLYATSLSGLVEIRYVERLPPGQVYAPAFQRADGQFWNWATQPPPDRDSFTTWSQTAAVAQLQAIEPTTVGTIDFAMIDQYLALVKSGELKGSLPDQSFEPASGFTVLFNSAPWTMTVTGRSKNLRFEKPYPSLRYALISGDLMGLDYESDRIVVRFRNLPAWSLSKR